MGLNRRWYVSQRGVLGFLLNTFFSENCRFRLTTKQGNNGDFRKLNNLLKHVLVD